LPLYEYECPQCGRFEKIQKFSSRPLKVCPTCGKGVERMLSAPAIQFKGSGWYITDYARKGDGKAEAKGDSKSDSKGESKSTEKSSEKSDGGGDKAASAASDSSKSSSTPKKDTSKKGAASSRRSP